MRVLWVTSHPPDPTRGGGWAFEFELVRLIAEHHEVTLLTAVDRDASVPAEVRDVVGRVVSVPWTVPSAPRSRLGLLWRVAREPIGGALAHASACAKALRDATALELRQGYDVVAVYPGESAEVLDVVSGPSVLFLTDIHTRQRENELALARTSRQRLLWRAELHKMRRWERRWYPRATVRTTVTAIDAAALRELTGLDAVVVPVTVGDEWFRTPTSSRSDHTVAFIGALDYRPNIDAVEWFCAEIWPHVAREHPSARLQVVGRKPVEEVRRAVGLAGGELFADVPDVFPHYWSAAVVVAPIRLGSGMRTKILHAMASGAPLVATSTAIEGIDLRADRDVRVADEPRAFADAVVADLRDPVAARARADVAAQTVSMYSTSAVQARVDDLLARAAASAR